MLDLIIETHVGLQRQGPGSPEATLKALGFLDDLGKDAHILDLACGTGGQTMVVAQNIPGDIIGLDLIPAFIDVFNKNATEQGLSKRVHGIVGSMDDLSFENETFDLIWCEGAIDNIGFENGMSYWNSFIKPGGYIAVTCPSWFTNDRPSEIEEFWNSAVGSLGTVGQNIDIMLNTGYSFIAAFVLPDKCWTYNYFAPRDAAEQALLKKYPGNEAVEAYIAADNYEAELFSKFSQYYGYAFYIGQKQS